MLYYMSAKKFNKRFVNFNFSGKRTNWKVTLSSRLTLFFQLAFLGGDTGPAEANSSVGSYSLKIRTCYEKFLPIDKVMNCKNLILQRIGSLYTKFSGFGHFASLENWFSEKNSFFVTVNAFFVFITKQIKYTNTMDL